MSKIRYNQINSTDLTGNGVKIVTATGATTANMPLLYDASGNAVIGTVQGNTTKVQLASGGFTNANLLMADVNGNAVDSGITSALGGVGLFPNVVTPPAMGSWSWVPSSQGGATLNSQLCINAPIDATGVTWRMVYVASPGSPFTIYAAVSRNGYFRDYSGIGVFARQSSTGKFIVASFVSETSVLKTAVTTQSAYNVGVANLVDETACMNPSYLWFKYQDDKGGTNNFIWSVSVDGIGWVQLVTASRTGYLTGDADQLGFCVRAGQTYNAAATLGSWNVTTP